MDKAQIQIMIDRADSARKNAYAPYSKLQVGAATLWESGTIYSGCNIENASFGMTICAERASIAQAISHGEKNLLAVCIISNFSRIIRPCGACLQVISEFTKSPALLAVISVSSSREYDIHFLSEYLPMSFEFKYE